MFIFESCLTHFRVGGWAVQIMLRSVPLFSRLVSNTSGILSLIFPLLAIYYLNRPPVGLYFLTQLKTYIRSGHTEQWRTLVVILTINLSERKSKVYISLTMVIYATFLLIPCHLQNVPHLRYFWECILNFHLVFSPSKGCRGWAYLVPCLVLWKLCTWNGKTAFPHSGSLYVATPVCLMI